MLVVFVAAWAALINDCRALRAQEVEEIGMLLVAQRDGVSGGSVNSRRATRAEIAQAPRHGDAVHVHAHAVEMQGQ
eukprot:7593375-Pyramimonas_sp.AAC.2